YFWLLLFEGALRKWALPELSAPLLVIRDPILLLIYYFSLRHGLLYRNLPLICIGTVAVAFIVAGALQFAFIKDAHPLVTLYGLRTNFFHLPLILIMAIALGEQDVQK